MAHSPSTTKTNRTEARPEGDPTPQPILFLLIEADRPTAEPGRIGLDGLKQVVLGRDGRRVMTPQETKEGRAYRVGVPDGFMSSTHATLYLRGRDWIVEDAGSKNGTFVNGVRVRSAVLHDGDVLEVGHTFFLFRDTRTLLPLDVRAADVEDLRPPTPELATLVPELHRMFAEIRQAVTDGCPVMVTGEPGTGKELIARSVHALSGRKGKFIAVNCASLTQGLVESELFGHRRGAFSGASEDRPGYIRAANRGTLFLDEIGDMRVEAQAVLLRVLQEGVVVPVGGGGAEPVPVDIALVSATNRDLPRLIGGGRFRADLYGRLDGLHIALPPLRERREDLGLMIGRLIHELAPDRAAKVKIENEAVRALLRYDFPGNVRQLGMVLQGALAKSSDVIRAGDSTLRATTPTVSNEPATRRPASDGEDGDARRKQLDALMREHRGNINAVARALGVYRKKVDRWLKRTGLDPDNYRD
jgi:transcriptional regulator with PAS, ATPase and Fis domain